MARIALLLVLFPIGAWAQGADSTLAAYLGSAGIVAIADTADNVEDLLTFRSWTEGDPCSDPPRYSGDPYALHEDLDGDGTLDAAALGLRGDHVVLAVCLGRAGGAVCGRSVVGGNRPFETSPRCQPFQIARFDGYRGIRLRPVALEETERVARREHPPVVGVMAGWSTSLFCLDEATAGEAAKLEACVIYN